VPIGRAVELGAGTIYVLQVGAFSRPRPEPRRPLDVAVQSYWLARHHRFKRDLESVPPNVDVHLLPTGQTPTMRYNDFTRSAELIALAYEASDDYLSGRPARPALPAGTASPVGVADSGGGGGDGDDGRDGPTGGRARAGVEGRQNEADD
jgi:hypothetical protein